jgi:hypothetical protein
MKGDGTSTFLGDFVEECFEVTVNPGDTVFLPAGWIHAVRTVAVDLCVWTVFVLVN